MLIKDLKNIAFDYQFISIIDDEYNEWWFGYLHSLPQQHENLKVIKIGSKSIERHPHESTIVVMI